MEAGTSFVEGFQGQAAVGGFNQRGFGVGVSVVSFPALDGFHMGEWS